MSQKGKLVQIRKLLESIVAGTRTRTSAEKAIAILDDIIGSLKGRGDAEVEYLVEDTVNGPALTERRAGGRAFPHRCPKPVYDAVADVLAKADRALPLDDIIVEAAKTLGDAPPEHQIRVPLRLWMQSEPCLVMRNRARYRASDARTFLKAAHAQWSTYASR